MVADWLWRSSASTRPTDNHHGYVDEFGLRLFTKSGESRRNDVVGKLHLDLAQISNSFSVVIFGWWVLTLGCLGVKRL
jgi:hypothetical protein